MLITWQGSPKFKHSLGKRLARALVSFPDIFGTSEAPIVLGSYNTWLGLAWRTSGVRQERAVFLREIHVDIIMQSACERETFFQYVRLDSTGDRTKQVVSSVITTIAKLGVIKKLHGD